MKTVRQESKADLKISGEAEKPANLKRASSGNVREKRKTRGAKNGTEIAILRERMNETKLVIEVLYRENRIWRVGLFLGFAIRNFYSVWAIATDSILLGRFS